jgi:hypothetical protein
MIKASDMKKIIALLLASRLPGNALCVMAEMEIAGYPL